MLSLSAAGRAERHRMRSVDGPGLSEHAYRGPAAQLNSATCAQLLHMPSEGCVVSGNSGSTCAPHTPSVVTILGRVRMMRVRWATGEGSVRPYPQRLVSV